MASNILLFDDVRTALIAEIGVGYLPLFLPFGHPMRILHFINDTNGSYMLTTDPLRDMMPLIGDSFNLYDGTSDEDSNEMARFAKGTQWYIKSLIAPTVDATLTNKVYLVCVYGKGE